MTEYEEMGIMESLEKRNSLKRCSHREEEYALPRRILIPVDLSKHSEGLIGYGHGLAHRLDVEACFLHVISHPFAWRGYEPWIPPKLDEELKTIAQKKIAHWVHKAEEKLDLPEHRHRIVIKEGSPAEEIIRFAKEEECNLIVIARQGHAAFQHFLVGSVASNVARHAHCSVLIYRSGLEEVL